MISRLTNTIKQDYFISYIYLYVFLIPWNFFNGQVGTLSIILIIWWLFIGKQRDYFTQLKYLWKIKPVLLLLIFFAYSYLSLLWTNNIAGAENTVLRFYKYYWIIIPVLFSSMKKQEAINALYIFILSLGGYAIFSVMIYLDLIHLKDTNHSNPKGILAYAIVTPYMAIGFLSSVLISIYEKNKKLKYLFFILSIVSFIALFINNGRAGQLAFFITFVVLAIIYRKIIFKNSKIIISGLLIVILSISALYTFGKLDRFAHSFNTLTHLEKNHFAGSWGARAYMWYAAADILKDNYVIGVGAGDHIDKFIEYTKTHQSKATWLRTYHNQHLDTLVRFGIIGYVLLWSSVLLLLYQLKNEKIAYSLAIVFFSITYFDGIGDIILLMKPYNDIFVICFMLFSVILKQNMHNKVNLI